MSRARNRYVITYDIENDRVRSKVSELLEGAGFRVQKSVFECLLAPDDLDRLVARIGRLAEGRGGLDVRVYRLCASCFADSFGLGEVEAGSGAEPWVVV